MTDLDKKLEQARENAVGYGEKRGLKDTADDYLKGIYAMLYQDLPSHLSSVAERDSWIRIQPEYIDAVEEKKNRYAGWTASEIYMRILFAEIDKYRTDKASDRTMVSKHL